MADKVNYWFLVCDLDNPTGLDLSLSQMVKYAKNQLRFNHFQGLDKEVLLGDLDKEPINAWVYLKNIGLGKETNRVKW